MINGWRAGNAYDPDLISTHCVHVLNDHNVSWKDTNMSQTQTTTKEKTQAGEAVQFP